MKKSSLLWRSLGGVGGLLGVSLGLGKVYANRKNRTLRSVGAEKFAEIFQKGPDVFDADEMAKQYRHSAKPYDLPKHFTRAAGFQWMDKQRQIIERPSKGEFPDHTIFYLHGGAYWADPDYVQFKAVAYIADRADARVVMPIYPKAPTHHAKQALKMVVDSYANLVKTAEPETITILGDSSGAGLALALAFKIRELGLPMPSHIVLMSPWLDVSLTNPEIPVYQEHDTILDANRLRTQGQLYAGDVAVTDPLVSPLYGDLSDLPPIDIFTGTADILYPDTEKFVEQAKKKGEPVYLHKFENQPHDFAVMPMPEAAQALDEISNIVESN
ncbi:alpha/beta hydrolase [Leuconostocaceae bacterium ESL0723]|nr:alpha/beta hydrolase [Leuconostocaceae bacterium ESL0723]